MQNMELNWTLEVIIILFSLIPFSAAVGVLYVHNKNYRLPAIFFQMLGWIMFTFMSILEVLGYLFLSKILFAGHVWFIAGTGFCSFLFLDLMNKERISPFKYIVLAALTSLNLLIAYLPESVEEYTFTNGDRSLSQAGSLRIISSIVLAYFLLYYIFYMSKLYISAPKSLKSYARLNLIGTIIWGPLSVLAFIMGLSLSIPGIVKLIQSIGALISAISFAKSPQLCYILPFRAQNIAVVERTNGILLYSHNWIGKSDNEKDARMMDDYSFNTILSGTIDLTKNTLGRGEIRSIKTENAIVSIRTHKTLPLIFLLVSTQVTHSLRRAFEIFIEKFETQYSIMNQAEYSLDGFKFGDRLIDQTFPFVPNYSAEDVQPSSPKSSKFHNSSSKKNGEIAPQSFSDVSVIHGPSDILQFCITCNQVKNPDGNQFSITDYMKEYHEKNVVWNVCEPCNKQKQIKYI